MAADSIDINDQATLKPVFGKYESWIPDYAHLQREIPFSVADSVGDYFTEPFEASTPPSTTWLGTNDSGLMDLVEPKPFQTLPVKVYPSSQVLRLYVSTQYADRGNVSGDSKKAFAGTLPVVAESMANEIRRTNELGILCGQDGVGEIESVDNSAKTITLKAQTFRAGAIAFSQNHRFMVIDSGSLDTAPVLDGLAVMVVSASIETRTITVVDTDGTTSPTITGYAAGDTLVMSGSYTRAAGAGAGTANEQIGLQRQIRLQTGTVFNISKGSNSAWRGNVVDQSRPASAGAVLDLSTKAINKGYQGEILAVVSPKFWNVLNSKFINVQTFNQQKPDANAEATLGTDAVVLRGQGVTVRCLAHPDQAESQVMLLPKPSDYIKRLGSSYSGVKPGMTGKAAGPDISFERPLQPGVFVSNVPGKYAVEMQVRTDQQVYLRRPAWAVLGTGFTFA